MSQNTPSKFHGTFTEHDNVTVDTIGCVFVNWCVVRKWLESTMKWALPVPIVRTSIFANAGNFALCVIVDVVEFNRGMGTRSNMYSYVYWQVAISSCKCKM